MHDKNAAWVARTWQHWHRPWTVTHPSWHALGHPMLVDHGANEHWLRLNYPAWCLSHQVAVALVEFRDSAWWRLFGLPSAAFDLVTQMVGWTLAYAAGRNRRLIRQGATPLDAALVRWALGRSHFVPPAVSNGLREGVPTEDAASWNAAASLRWCVQDEDSALWPRMRLRCPRELVQAQDGWMPFEVEPQAQAHLAMLWSAATRRVLASTATPSEPHLALEATP
jgi:hypothetical protein